MYVLFKVIAFMSLKVKSKLKKVKHILVFAGNTCAWLKGHLICK